MHLRLYFKALVKHWWPLLSCAVFTLISIVAALTNRSNRWIVWTTGTCAFLLLLVASYLAWRDEYDRAEKEQGKNEAAPHMDVNVLNVVPHGNLHEGLTDLFLRVGLVLQEPSEVCIDSFSITVSDNSNSSTFLAVDDIHQWEHVKPEHDGGVIQVIHTPCTPLTMQLMQRGENVSGWLHFPLHGVTESFLQRRYVTLEIKCTHGNCYTRFDGFRALPDPDVKGRMRKSTD